MITEEEALYMRLAMAIDTDGHINILKVKNKKGFGYSQNIRVTNTNFKLMEWLIENFGGGVVKTVFDEDKNHKDLYQWQLYGYESYKALKRIYPHLLLKQKQGETAIELWEKVSKKRNGPHKMPEYKRKLAEELFQRNKMLNKRGRTKEEKEQPKLLRRIITTLEEYD